MKIVAISILVLFNLVGMTKQILNHGKFKPKEKYNGGLAFFAFSIVMTLYFFAGLFTHD